MMWDTPLMQLSMEVWPYLSIIVVLLISIHRMCFMTMMKKKHIPPMRELFYDYNYDVDQVLFATVALQIAPTGCIKYL